jgi:hypothetical protein
LETLKNLIGGSAMKLVKSDFLSYLNRISVKGLVEEFVAEENGLVVSIQKDKGLVLVGNRSDFKGFGKRVGISNLSLLIKMVSALEAADNQFNVEVKGNDLVLATKSGKYTFKLSDPDAIGSEPEKAEAMAKLKGSLSLKLDLTIESINAISKSISVLSTGKNDVLSIFANEGKVQAVITDEATKSTSSVDIGSSDLVLKVDFEADKFAKLLGMADASKGLKLFLDDKKPLLLEVPDKSFMYMLSFLVTKEDK